MNPHRLLSHSFVQMVHAVLKTVDSVCVLFDSRVHGCKLGVDSSHLSVEMSHLRSHLGLKGLDLR